MHEKKKYRNIPCNRYNLEKYRDINFWSYRPALGLETGATSLEQTEKKSFSFETYKQQGFRLTFCTGFTGAAQKLGAPKFSYRQY